MALVDSLLTAIMRADGDALVLHVGERPYVVASAGPLDLSARPLNLGAMEGMLGQFLPADTQRALQELGAIEHELASLPAMAGDRFTVVAARGGDDIWIELRRHRRLKPGRRSPRAMRAETPAQDSPAPMSANEAAAPTPMPAPYVTPAASAPPADFVAPVPAPEPPVPQVSLAPLLVGPPTPALAPEPEVAAPGREAPPAAPPAIDSLPVTASIHPPSSPETRDDEAAREEGSFGPATVVPLRAVARPDHAPRPSSRPGGLERLLRVAASRGASALYLMSQSSPAIRVDGEVQVLAGEAPLTSDDVEAAVLEILPEGSSESVRRGETTEWICELADIGRLRCTTFHDHRGPGALVRMISARPLSAEQLGLSREIQALATEPEGLVVVAGPRGSGKSTLVAAMVDLVNRQRADYVITLERQIRLVHEHGHSLISQREVRGHSDEVVAAARAALRENPDVLVIEDLRSHETLQVALDAAGSGLLVVVSVTASATTAAIERLLDLVPAERRPPVQAALAERLRGAVSQVLLRKTGGGRLAARELLLGTSAVAGLVGEGQLAQLPRAIDSGRKHGMLPLNDALVAFVESGAVDVREAYRKAGDRAGLLAQLKREGIDTSIVERLA